MVQTEEASGTRPLLWQYELTPLFTWSEWLAAWDDPSVSYLERYGLVASGFNLQVNSDDDQARLRLYLQIADTYYNFATYADHTNDGETIQQYLARYQLGRLAMVQLHQHIFPLRESDETRFAYFLLDDETRKVLITFFRAEETTASLANVVPDHRLWSAREQQSIRTFLKAMIDFIWGVELLSQEANDEERERMLADTHLLVPILKVQKRLRILEDPAYVLVHEAWMAMDAVVRGGPEPICKSGSHRDVYHARIGTPSDAAMVLMLRH